MFDGQDLDLEALAVAEPGPGLSALLAQVDTRRINGHARVVVMGAFERLASWAAGRMYDVMAEVARSPEGGPDSGPELNATFGEFASAEVGAALTMSPGGADFELSLAYELTERLPGTRAALLAGRINLAKARAIASQTCVLSAELALQAESWVLGAAPGLTRQQLLRRLRAKVLALDPEGAQERRKESVRERRVRFEAGEDGTGDIGGYQLPLAGVAAARAYVKAAARSVLGAGDARTLAQIEADVFLDLLQGRPVGADGVQGRIELVAPVETWLRLSAEAAAAASAASTDQSCTGQSCTGQSCTGQSCTAAASGGTAAAAGRAQGYEPGDLAGFGPVSAETIAAIMKAATSGFDYSCTATLDGQVVYHQGRLAYRPTTKQREFLAARDRTCRHPGCTRPGTYCDADHTMEHRLGGPTCTCNLGLACRRHHRAKHEGRWWWIQPKPGTFSVQSPLGHTYTREPDPLPGGDPATPAEPLGRRRTVADFLPAFVGPPTGLTREQAGTPF